MPMGDESRGMGTIHAMLAHVFFCEHYYADMLQNKNPDIPELTRLYHRMMEQPVADLCRFGCDAQQRLADFAVAADEE
jgi:hypothetical protein